MSEIIVVRSERCEGCLFGKFAVVQNAKNAIKFLRDNPDPVFNCHCHHSDVTGNVMCNGFYTAFKERFKDAVIRFTRKKGKKWQFWLKYPIGGGVFRNREDEIA